MINYLNLTPDSHCPPLITFGQVLVKLSLKFSHCSFDPADRQTSKQPIRQFMFARLFSTRERTSEFLINALFGNLLFDDLHFDHRIFGEEHTDPIDADLTTGPV